MDIADTIKDFRLLVVFAMSDLFFQKNKLVWIVFQIVPVDFVQ